MQPAFGCTVDLSTSRSTPYQNHIHIQVKALKSSNENEFSHSHNRETSFPIYLGLYYDRNQKYISRIELNYLLY